MKMDVSIPPGYTQSNEVAEGTNTILPMVQKNMANKDMLLNMTLSNTPYSTFEGTTLQIDDYIATTSTELPSHANVSLVSSSIKEGISFYGNKDIHQNLPPGSLMRGESTADLAPLSLITVILIVAIGNLLVILTVRFERRLHQTTFYFFVSMSTTHLLMAATTMPPAVMVSLAGTFSYHEDICKLWVTVDLFLCNNTCLHLAFCSMDTFLRLKDPVRHGRPTTTCSLLLWLGAPWVISSVQAIAQFMLSQADHGITNNGICFIPDKNFLILGTLFSFLIPAIISVVFYTLSFHEIQGLRKGKYIEESEVSGGHNGYGSHDSFNEDVEDDISDTTSCVSEVVENHSVQSHEKVQLAVVTSMKDSSNLKQCQEVSTSFCNVEEPKVCPAQNNLAFPDHLLAMDQSSSCTLLLREDGAEEEEEEEDSTMRDHCQDEDLRHEIIINRLMFLLLLCCITLWIPFSVSNIVYSVCDGCRKNMTFLEMLTFRWLAYSSAMVGPIVYAKYSDVMREGYWNVLTCKCCH